MFVHGAGQQFYYAADADGYDYHKDMIARRGTVVSSTVLNKVPGAEGGGPLRTSEKPVTLLQYFITAFVRAFSTPDGF